MCFSQREFELLTELNLARSETLNTKYSLTAGGAAGVSRVKDQVIISVMEEDYPWSASMFGNWIQ